MTKIGSIQNYGSINFSSNKGVVSQPQKSDKKEQEEGLSSTSKALIALGVLGAAGLGLYFLTRGKKGAEQLAEAGQDARRAISSGKDDIVSESPRIINTTEPYANKEVVKKLQALTGSTEEKLEAAKKIFMEELGYNPDLIKIEISDKLPSADLFNPTSLLGGFHYYTGSLILNGEAIKKMPSEMAIATLRHELDHFDKAAKICKSIGVEEYQKLFNGVPEDQFISPNGSKLSFNTKFWQNAIRETKTEGFESEKYTQALRDYFNITQPDGSLYSKYLGDYQYVTNPMETSAFSIEHSLEKSLGVDGMFTPEYLKKDFKMANDALTNLVKQQPELEAFKPCIFDYLFSKAVILSDAELNAMHTKLLSEPNNTALTKEFGEKLQQKFNAIRGSFLGKDIESEAKALQKFSEIAQKPIATTDVIDSVNAQVNRLYNGLSDFMISAEQKEIIKPKFFEINRQLLEYMKKNNIENPLLEIQSLLKQLIVEKDIKGITFITCPKIKDLNIPEETLQRIYSNKIMQEQIAKYPQYTEEQIFLSILRNFVGSRF